VAYLDRMKQLRGKKRSAHAHQCASGKEARLALFIIDGASEASIQANHLVRIESVAFLREWRIVIMMSQAFP